MSWRARTFAQAHCNSQKLAAGHRSYTTHGQFTHTSSGHRPSPVPARCTPHGQGTCRSGRQDIGPSNSFPRRVPTHRERATRRAPWEGEGQSRRQDIGPGGSAPPAHRKAEPPNSASPDTAGAGNVGPAPAAGDAGPVTTGIGSTGTAGISAFGTGGPFGRAGAECVDGRVVSHAVSSTGLGGLLSGARPSDLTAATRFFITKSLWALLFTMPTARFLSKTNATRLCPLPGWKSTPTSTSHTWIISCHNLTWNSRGNGRTLSPKSEIIAVQAPSTSASSITTSSPAKMVSCSACVSLGICAGWYIGTGHTL